MKSRKYKAKLAAMIAVLIVSVATMAAFGTILAMDWMAARQGQNFFAEVAVTQVVMPVGQLFYLPSAASQTGETVRAVQINTMQEDEASKLVLPVINFDELRTSMPNIVGWIQSPGTVINYPIVQGADNDFYLYHLPDGRRNAMGSIFLDYRNEADFSGTNIFIYGHNMASGHKFSTLSRYESHEFFMNHGTMFIFAPHGNYALVIFAGYNIDSSVEHPPMYFADEAAFDRYIADLRRRSFIRSDAEVSYGDRLVFLCTCVFMEDSPWRRIVVGRLMPLD